MLFSHQLTKMLFALRKNNMTINLRCLCLVIVSLASLQLSGCASITGGTQQSISVETKKDASAVPGAECEIINGKGKWFISTPGSAQIQRSNDPLLITCNKSGFDTGRASVESIVRAGMAGNFIFGGLIGAAIDHASGAGYDYPNLVQVFMGQSNVLSYNYETGSAPNSVISRPAQTDGNNVSSSNQLTSPATMAASTANSSPRITNLILSADGTTTPQSSGPSSSAEMAKMEAAKVRCIQLGFVPQTDPFGQCMQRLIQ
jgi:hypothetical protein